ncbi:hypothetical protein CY34DRAFT_808848 [Suillus luteus UH-Slu-Lm8-n1]|uniref:Uncharacterized protein n=1 Tax=Suillus luteus UH-Slu-Lm8-n1 TaxID=930992 RepID=A0A0D0AAX2_9AGAM|nr:hypothetical protein CY34DRAFT_808848 [Suillus luteus UH-Slu-Lm8-n1]
MTCCGRSGTRAQGRRQRLIDLIRPTGRNLFAFAHFCDARKFHMHPLPTEPLKNHSSESPELGILDWTINLTGVGFGACCMCLF